MEQNYVMLCVEVCNEIFIKVKFKYSTKFGLFHSILYI